MFCEWECVTLFAVSMPACLGVHVHTRATRVEGLAQRPPLENVADPSLCGLPLQQWYECCMEGGPGVSFDVTMVT